MQEPKFDYMIEGTEKKTKKGEILTGFYAVFVGTARELALAIETL
jgi:hypothetical protein